MFAVMILLGPIFILQILIVGLMSTHTLSILTLLYRWPIVILHYVGLGLLCKETDYFPI